MKNILIMCLLSGCGYIASAASVCNVTKQAAESFKKQYPGALYATWKILNDDCTYAVRFVFNNESVVAYYDEEGAAIGFEKLVATDKFPVNAKATLNRMFAGYKILSAEELLLFTEHFFSFEIVIDEEKLLVSIYDNGKIKKVHH